MVMRCLYRYCYCSVLFKLFRTPSERLFGLRFEDLVRWRVFDATKGLYPMIASKDDIYGHVMHFPVPPQHDMLWETGASCRYIRLTNNFGECKVDVNREQREVCCYIYP